MRIRVLAATAVSVFGAAGPAAADPGTVSSRTYLPPFVEHVQWAHWSQLSSLRVYPTTSGRGAANQLGSLSPEADEAWAEVLRLAPQADTPGMREQFRCHWDFAENAQPGKASWNLEPWRPVVDDATMVASGCNPGGGQGPF